MLVIIGSERRIRHDRELAAGAHAAVDRAARELGEVFGSPIRITPDTLPAVLATAQRSVDAASRVSIPRDASEPLAALLRTWPSAALPDADPGDAVEASHIGWACTIQTLGVTADSIALTLTIEGDAAAFLRGLSAPPGWSLAEPRLTSIGRPAITKRPASRDAATSSSDPDADEKQPDLPLTRVMLTLRPAAESSASSATASPGASP